MPTPRLLLPYLVQSQAQKEATHNTALNGLDLVVQASVLDRNLTVPPVGPGQGDTYVVAAGATGAWSGRDGNLAAWYGTGWVFVDPWPGFIAFIVDEERLIVRGSAGWAGLGAVAGLAPGDVAGLTAALDAKAALAGAAFTGTVSVTGGTARLLVAHAGGVATRVGGTDVAPQLQVNSTSGATGILVGRYSNDGSGGRIHFLKTRGATAATFAATVAGDGLGQISWAGSDAVRACEAARLDVVAADVAGAVYTPARMRVMLPPIGGGSIRETFGLEQDASLSILGSIIVDGNRIFRLRAYAAASLPAAGTAAGQTVYCSDLHGVGGPVVSNGSHWLPAGEGGFAAPVADASHTVNPLTDAACRVYGTTLAADRTITLGTANAYPGARFHIARTAGGVFALNVGGLKTLAQNQWCEVRYGGSAWVLTAFGSL